VDVKGESYIGGDLSVRFHAILLPPQPGPEKDVNLFRCLLDLLARAHLAPKKQVVVSGVILFVHKKIAPLIHFISWQRSYLENFLLA